MEAATSHRKPISVEIHKRDWIEWISLFNMEHLIYNVEQGLRVFRLAFTYLNRLTAEYFLIEVC